MSIITDMARHAADVEAGPDRFLAGRERAAAHRAYRDAVAMEAAEYAAATRHLAPCGDDFDTEQAADTHMVTCGACAGAVEAHVRDVLGITPADLDAFEVTDGETFETLCGVFYASEESVVDHYARGCDDCEAIHAPDCQNHHHHLPLTASAPADDDAMACYTLTEDNVHACTAEFGHDGNHTAHGPDREPVKVWPRRATDRDAGDARQRPSLT
jgi:hypothetical protein